MHVIYLQQTISVQSAKIDITDKSFNGGFGSA